MSQNVTVSVFGDCQTVRACSIYPHTRVAGLISWLTLFSDKNKKFIDFSKKLNQHQGLSDYEKRICKLDANKTTLQFLLEKKSDFLILDGNDCRQRIISESQREADDFLSPSITEKSYMNGFNELLRETTKDIYIYNCSFFEKKCWDIVIKKACDAILSVYPSDRIIINKHYFSKYYIDSGILKKYDNKAPWRDGAIETLRYVDQLLENNLCGCHVINFPDNVLGNINDPLGLNPLHYDSLYIKYCRECIDLIINESEYEKIELEQKRIKYSYDFYQQFSNAKTQNLKDFFDEKVKTFYMFLTNESSTNILKSIKFISSYLDALNLIKHKVIILISTKDTPGFYDNRNIILQRIYKLGFEKFSNKLQIMYGAILDRGVIIAEKTAKDIHEKISFSVLYNKINVEISSFPYLNGNKSCIKVDGVDYSCNRRGINLVVVDCDTKKVIDTVSYDSHFISSEHMFRKIIS